jgi:multidrug efflux pump subunit AcrA (membrane-fusion protein)
VIFDGYPEKSYKLTVKEWDTQADPQTLSYRVVFSLPSPEDFNLLAGMTGNVLIDLNQVLYSGDIKFTIPSTAVFSDDQINSFVWRYRDNKLEKVQVQLGDIHRAGIEVLSGINPGDQIVSAGVHYLNEDSNVRPLTKERGL